MTTLYNYTPGVVTYYIGSIQYSLQPLTYKTLTSQDVNNGVTIAKMPINENYPRTVIGYYIAGDNSEAYGIDRNGNCFRFGPPNTYLNDEIYVVGAYIDDVPSSNCRYRIPVLSTATGSGQIYTGKLESALESALDSLKDKLDSLGLPSPSPSPSEEEESSNNYLWIVIILIIVFVVIVAVLVVVWYLKFKRGNN